MEWKWTFNIENNYVRKGKEWNYWQYILQSKGWLVKDHSFQPGYPCYGSGMWPDQTKVQLQANTKSVGSPKTFEIFIGFFHNQEGLKKSHRVTFTAKSDGLFSNWEYYCNEQLIGESFYDNKSFEFFLVINEDWELEIVKLDKAS